MTAAAILREIINDPKCCADIADKIHYKALAQVERDEALMKALIEEHDAVTRGILRGSSDEAMTGLEVASARHRVAQLLRARELEAQE